MSTPLTVKIPIKDAQGRVVGEKEVATYAGLLARAHEEGLSAIRTEVVQVPNDGNGGVAIVTAQVTTNKGTFCGIGDASERNVNRRIAPHIIRMAETRSKARALRDAVNIGVVALDELGDEVDETPESHGGASPSYGFSAGQADPPPAHERTPASSRSNENGNGGNGNGSAGGYGSRGASSGNGSGNGSGSAPFTRMTEPQRRLLFRLLGEQGFDGDGAQGELCRRANVAALSLITKGKASELIEAMKAGGNGAGHA